MVFPYDRITKAYLPRGGCAYFYAKKEFMVTSFCLVSDTYRGKNSEANDAICSVKSFSIRLS